MQSAHCEQHDAQECLTRQQDGAPAELVGRERPHEDSCQIDHADLVSCAAQIGLMGSGQRTGWSSDLRKDQRAQEWILETGEREKVGRIGCDDCEATELTAGRENHDGEGTFLGHFSTSGAF